MFRRRKLTMFAPFVATAAPFLPLVFRKYFKGCSLIYLSARRFFRSPRSVNPERKSNAKLRREMLPFADNKNSIRRRRCDTGAGGFGLHWGAEIKRPAPARLRGTKRCLSSKAWLGLKRDGFVEFCRQLPPQIRSSAFRPAWNLVSSAGTRAQRSCAGHDMTAGGGNLPRRFGLT